jgi:hypothetical protein
MLALEVVGIRDECVLNLLPLAPEKAICFKALGSMGLRLRLGKTHELPTPRVPVPPQRNGQPRHDVVGLFSIVPGQQGIRSQAQPVNVFVKRATS